MLLFKKKYLPAIRAGEKTQTIRLWPCRRMRAGQRSYIPGVGYIRIEAVDEVALADLTDADAQPDGFATAAALRSELESLYRDRLRAGPRPYCVRFAVLPQGETQKTRRRRRAARRGAAGGPRKMSKTND
jgi:hypothetical protein